MTSAGDKFRTIAHDNFVTDVSDGLSSAVGDVKTNVHTMNAVSDNTETNDQWRHISEKIDSRID